MASWNGQTHEAIPGANMLTEGLLGDQAFSIGITPASDMELVPAWPTISLRCDQTEFITYREDIDVFILWFDWVVEALSEPAPCSLRDACQLEAFARLYYDANLEDAFQRYQDDAKRLLVLDKDRMKARFDSLPAKYGISDLLGGGSFDPVGFCYVFTWSPTAHIAVLGQQGQFWSLSEPTHSALQRFVNLKHQLAFVASRE